MPIKVGSKATTFHAFFFNIYYRKFRKLINLSAMGTPTPRDRILSSVHLELGYSKKLSWIFLAQQIVAMQRKLPRCEVSKKETQRGFDGKNERRRRSNEGQG